MKNKIVFVLTIFMLLIASSTAHAEIKNGMAASVVVGEPDFVTNTVGGAGPRQTNSRVWGVLSAGGKFFVADTDNHRVLAWNQVPTQNFAPADYVIGQPNFNAVAAGTTQRSLSFPRDVIFAEGKLLIVDNGNNRILIWNRIPTSNNEPADVVLGQPDFAQAVANNGGISARTLSALHAITSAGGKLFVADFSNNRVLIFNKIPTSNFAAADVVVGQPDFSTATANNGGISARSLNGPLGVASDGKYLMVSSNNNHRVLIWNTLPTTNFAPADVVVGQPDFQANSAALRDNRLNTPRGIATDGKRLFVGDSGNSRILIFNEIPTSNFASADFVIGSSNFNEIATNTVTDSTFGFPVAFTIDAHRLFVSDENRGAVLIFNIGETDADDLGPQFSQGKAVVGKVFFDWNGNGEQDAVGPPKSAADLSGDAGKDWNGNGIQGVRGKG